MPLDQTSEITPERWQQIKAILCDALEFEREAERQAYLASACGDDTALRREVESFLEPFPDNVEAFADNLRTTLGRRIWIEPIGRRLGAYKIISEIGRGGMGSVYLAERADGQFEKQVAIKLLKRGTDTDEILRRFRAEREILARLDHPNIARLIDAGTTDDGLPYFIMEYVAGSPVTRYVKENCLSLHDRLKLFLKVCTAVEFAHDNSVVHRDLKPNNILINVRAEPKLLDFGIAKLIASDPDSREATVFEERRLTPSYASPEQALGGPITFATDIYALGTLLYEILSEHNPHRFSTSSATPEEVARVISKQEPRPPSQIASEPELQRQLKDDLDNIILLALRKEPRLRYASVKELADDIQRFLGGERTKARRKSIIHLTRSFFERERSRPMGLAFAGAALIIAALIVAAGVVSLRHLQARNPEGALTGSIEKTAVLIPAKSIAVLPFQNLSEQKENAFFTAGVQDEILTDLAKVADLKVISRTSVEQFTSGTVHNRREIGERLKVAHLLEGSIQRSANRVRVTAKLTDARTNVQLWAETYDKDLEDVFAIQSEIAQAIVSRLQVTLLPHEKADIEAPPTRDITAYDLYLQGKDIVNSYLDAQDPKASLLRAVQLLKGATARDPNFTLAYCYTARAHDLLYFLDLDPSPSRTSAAEQAARTALRLQPDSAESHLAMADHYFRCYRDLERAEKELNIARVGLPNSQPFFALRGYIFRRRGRWDAAERDFTKAVELDPRNVNAVNLLADNEVLTRRFSDAVRTYQRAVVAGVQSPVIFIRIAIIQFAATGDLAKLRAALTAAPADMDVGGGETPLRIFIALVDRDYDGAVQALAASPRADFQEVDFSFYYPRAWYEAIIARAHGDREKARDKFMEARPILAARLKAKPDDARILGLLGEIDAGLGNKQLAIDEGRRAVELMPVNRDAYDGALVLQNLAQIYTWTGEKESAVTLIAKLITMPGYLSYGYLGTDRSWDPLRSQPGFTEIVAKAKTPSVTIDNP